MPEGKQSEMILYLQPGFFSQKETCLVEYGPLSASLFRFESGVCAVRLKSDMGELVLLPFQGQQVWSAVFGGRNLTMKSMVKEPRPNVPFLETFGGFLVHCGATAMGGPSSQDTHPLHGELPNAAYQTAFLFMGEDEGGSYIGLGGCYQHTVAFSTNYVAEPRVKLYAGQSRFWLTMKLTNLKNTPMDLMYLVHINFKPVDNARLVYSAYPDPEHVKVRTQIPAHIKPGPGYREFIEELRLHPEKHHVLSPGLAYDPEVAITIDHIADPDGWAHTLQVLPDGTADYVRHRPDQMDRCIRWISRTPDQDALGIEPANAGVEGYLAEKAKGNVKVLAAGGVLEFQIEIGALTALEAGELETKIQRMIAA